MAELISEEKRNDGFFNGEWLRKATETEIHMEMGHLEGHFVIWYQLDLSSQDPLQENQIRAAAEHLYRKVPSFGACFAMRDGVMWLKRAINPEVDFKALQGLSLEEMRESLRETSFKSNTGPLFCIRFLQDSQDHDQNLEDLEPSLPHKCHVFFGIHHGFVDGTSNMHIMGMFASIINNVVSGNPINNEECYGSLVSDEETERLVRQKKMTLEVDPKLRQQISDELEFRRTYTPLIIKEFPVPNEKARTATIVEVLDRNTTNQFIQRCKQEKTTVNSAFTALISVALVDVLAEYGVIQESYVIQNSHSVNLRRYWEVKSSIALGCHMAFPLVVFTETPRDVEHCFWEYAASLNQILKEKVESGRILFDKAFELLASSSSLHSEKHSQGGSFYEGDFVTSNMGDVTAMVTKGGDKVRITNVVRGTTFHKTPYPVLVNCHTYRGRFTFTFEYNTEVLEAKVAQRISFRLVKRMREMAERQPLTITA